MSNQVLEIKERWASLDQMIFAKRYPDTWIDHAKRDIVTLINIIETHDLCHDLHGKVGPCEFAKGCEKEQRRIFSQATHADRIQDIRKKLEGVIETEGCDAGVIYLSNDGPCHTETVDDRQMSVYDHEYFSPLGDALMEIYKMTEPI